VRIELVEVPYFAVSAPTEIAISGFPQIGICDLVEPSRRVESRGDLVGNRLVVNESVGTRRADGLFIKAFGIEQVALDAGNLCPHQCGAVLEIRGAVL